MLLRDHVTVLNAANLAADAHGNPVPDWVNATSRPERAFVQPVSTQEITPGQVTVVSRWKAVLSPTTVATSRSRLRWRGDTYEVDGEVQLATDLLGRPHHSQALLIRAT